MKKYFLAIALLFSLQSHAQQINRDDFDNVRQFVGKIGAMKEYPVKSIIDTLHSQHYTAHQMVYGIYLWIAENIDFDCRGQRKPKRSSATASVTLNDFSGSSEGYANLFKAMCDVAKITSIKVNGQVKTHPEEIGKLSKFTANHFWNMVFIDNTWYNIDAAMGAGTTDLKIRSFTRNLTDAWFYTNNELFQLSHYAVGRKIPIADVGITKSIFTNAPVIYAAAVVFDVHPMVQKEKVKARQDVAQTFQFRISNPALVKNVMIIINDEKIITSHEIKDGILTVDVPFVRHGKYSFTIAINGKETIGYMAEVAKGKPKPKAKHTKENRYHSEKR